MRFAMGFAMRILLFMLAMIVVTAGIGTRAQAQNYPWCAVYRMGDVSYNCGFVTRDQCMASVSGIGGSCEPNTQYRPAATPLRPELPSHS
jgi:hypothetical protein